MSGSTHHSHCEGQLFPLIDAEHDWDSGLRAVLYAVAMIYLFLGVNIVADKFVASIESITSKKCRVRLKGSQRKVTVKLWNDTVANLTLLALGSSAPEIILAIVEILRNGFEAGDIGPSTIVGSAAFNLFVIIGVCICSIPSPETRSIEKHSVFIITAVCSLFAYAWMLFIVSVSSPNVIDVWEGVLTVLFFPLLVIVSFFADIGWLFNQQALSSPMQKHPPKEVTLKKSLDSDVNLADTSDVVKDKDGVKIGNAAGVLTFANDTLEVCGSSETQNLLVPVFRKNGVRGTVRCKYRTEKLSAIPGFDYDELEGVLVFEPGICRKDVQLTLLSKQRWEHSDCFQLILEDAEGGVLFNPNDDGGESRCLLTIMILNRASDKLHHNFSTRALTCIDGIINMDAIRSGNTAWRVAIKDAVLDIGNGSDGEESSASASEWAMHIIALPWKLAFALFIPPTEYAGGWICFSFSLLCIGGLTSIICDFAELFGCITGVKDSITAITFVALGTSMPDLFASRTSAVQDDTADASIVNVTGSNSVNVFLGIGLPWTLGAAYWSAQGRTFRVNGGDLGFSVMVFFVGAIVALAVIHFRRVRYGGELGGPVGPKILSGILFVLLWGFYVGLSVWQIAGEVSAFKDQVVGIMTGVFVLENTMLVLGCGVLWFLKSAGPKDARDVETGLAGACREVRQTSSSELSPVSFPDPLCHHQSNEDILRASAVGDHQIGFDASCRPKGVSRLCISFRTAVRISQMIVKLRKAVEKRRRSRKCDYFFIGDNWCGSPTQELETDFLSSSRSRRSPQVTLSSSFASVAMVCWAASRFRRGCQHVDSGEKLELNTTPCRSRSDQFATPESQSNAGTAHTFHSPRTLAFEEDASEPSVSRSNSTVSFAPPTPDPWR